MDTVDRRVGEHELIEVLEHRELGAADAIADRASLPMGALGPDQAGDQRVDLVTPDQPLTSNLKSKLARIPYSLSSLMASRVSGAEPTSWRA